MELCGDRSQEETKLFVNAILPYGSTVDHMDFVLGDFENYLSTVNGIDKYVTTVLNGQYGRIEISFKDEQVFSGLPYELESRLLRRILEWDGVEWNIYGVGQGFNNAGFDDIPRFRIIMRGYNYDELERQATRLAGKLLSHERIQRVNTNDQYSFD